MHNLVARVETAFDAPRLRRGMLPFDRGQHTPDFHNGTFVSSPGAEVFRAAGEARPADRTIIIYNGDIAQLINATRDRGRP